MMLLSDPPNLIDGLNGAEGQIGDSVVVPTNVIVASNTSSNDQYLRLCRANGIKPHPARFPQALPEFAIGLCTEPGDLVLDPFAGSNMTGYVAEKMGRHWLAIEKNESYLKGATFRFVEDAFASEPDSGTQVVQRRFRGL
jgi:site-specific DNA-methyltransferase (cytosine-N4-specific)